MGQSAGVLMSPQARHGMSI